jgi:cold shock protein
MMTRISGIVALWNSDRGFGFIARDDGQGDIFVHVSDLPQGHTQLPLSAPVDFIVAPGRNGKPRAADVRLRPR